MPRASSIFFFDHPRMDHLSAHTGFIKLSPYRHARRWPRLRCGICALSCILEYLERSSPQPVNLDCSPRRLLSSTPDFNVPSRHASSQRIPAIHRGAQGSTYSRWYVFFCDHFFSQSLIISGLFLLDAKGAADQLAREVLKSGLQSLEWVYKPFSSFYRH